MSTIFYDRLIVLNDVDKKLKKLVNSTDELHEMWTMIEELIHHRVFGCILNHLPNEHHNEFLEKFHTSPSDKKLLSYLKEKVNKDMEKIIKQEVKVLKADILKDLKKNKK